MIQRIQSIYFLLGAIALFVYAFFCSNSLLLFTENLLFSFLPAIGSVFVAFLSLVIIFLFKKRNFQSTISSILMLLIIAIIAFTIYFFGFKNFYLDWTFYLLPLALVLLFFGRKNVVADEKLIKSVDRLR